MPEPQKPPLPPSIAAVLDEELQQIKTSRKLRLDPGPQRPAAQKSLIGLAFSGGGIRSATFNLGVLQALAKRNLLRSIDYVSTVSGGGYIGGWLMGWMHHQELGIRDIESRLSTPPSMPGQAGDLPEIHFLRDYSNYLTPRKGLFGGDFLAFLASYLRNTFLNQIILVLALLSLLLVPRSILYLLHLLEDCEQNLQGTVSCTLQPFMQSQYFALACGFFFGLVAIIFIGLNLETVDPRKGKRNFWFAYPAAVHALIIVPLIFSSAFIAYAFSQLFMQWGIIDHPAFYAPFLGFVLYFGMWAIACAVRFFFRLARRHSGTGGPAIGWILLTAAATGLLIGYLFVPYAHILIPNLPEGDKPYSNWHVMTFGAPVAIGLMLLAGVIHIGFMGRSMGDPHREWWGRLGGWLMLAAFLWLSLFLISIYFPPELERLLHWEAHRTGHPVTASGVAVWILSTAYGVFFGKSGKTSKWDPDAPFTKKLMALAAKLSPYIFILGVLLGLSLFDAYLASWLKHLTPSPFAAPSPFAYDARVPLLCLIFFAAALFVSWRVDINEFSIHYLYRNRLVRCYLGASVPGRNAQPFTGFSEEDNLALGKLKIPAGSTDPKDGRPLPILNTSLNVVRGEELALQARKARSFALTPTYSGFTRVPPSSRDWDAAYGPTEKLACKLPGFKDGATLGTAVAISGAAASPNMGFYSEPGLAFLMTLFDVRLGWWVGNPLRDGWEKGSPSVGFLCLLQELLGTASDESKYVYLSDGGHFENLAIYELVRRRCKLIIAGDASCDSAYAFGDLHNAIERCRTDFGVEITVDGLQELMPKPSSSDPGTVRSGAHFAVGKIRYNPNFPEEDGTIIYLKPALVGGDPQDVLAYVQNDKSFPHDTTADQWFDENRFESYRALGEATGAAAAEEIASETRRILG
ncbi:MAG: hypothetical protein WBD19_01245 [Candidatus Acidiferrum sp.]